MYFQRLQLKAIAYLTIFPFTQCSSLRRPSLGPLYSTIDNGGKPLSILRSNSIPDFGITTIWIAFDEEPPYWLRSIEPSNVTHLIDALSGIYSSRPPYEVGKYTTVGPESSAAFTNFSTRVTVKEGVALKTFDCPQAPMRNKEIVEAARMVRYSFNYKHKPLMSEWAWQMFYEDPAAGRVKNCTGVLFVQRDLWFDGA